MNCIIDTRDIKKRETITTALVSIPRSGKHWLLAGIFDTLGIYPKNYLEEVSKGCVGIIRSKTENYKITVKVNNTNITFSSPSLLPISSLEIEIMNIDKIIFLYRINKEKQAKSLINRRFSKVCAIYKDNMKLPRKNPSKREIQTTINQLEIMEKQFISLIKEKPYLKFSYEELEKNYEYCVKEIIRYIFNITIPCIKYIHPTYKIHPSHV